MYEFLVGLSCILYPLYVFGVGILMSEFNND